MKWPKFIIVQIVVLFFCLPLSGLAGSPAYEQEAAILDKLRAAVDRHGSRDYKTVPYRLELADFYLSKDEFYKAEPLLHQVRRMMERRLGLESVKLLPVLDKLASLDLRQNRFAFAFNLYERAIKIATRHYGKRSSKTKKIKTALVDARRAAREWKRFGRRVVAVKKTKPAPVLPTAKVKHDKAAKAHFTALNKPAASVVASVPANRVVVKSVDNNIKKSAVTKVAATKQPAISKVKSKPAPTQPGQVRSAALSGIVSPKSEQSSANPRIVKKTHSSIIINLDSEGIPREPSEEDKHGFFISMGCFSDKKFALGQVSRVMAIPVSVYLKSIRGDSLHCVFGGPFSSRYEAEESADLARSQAKVEDTLIRQYK